MAVPRSFSVAPIPIYLGADTPAQLLTQFFEHLGCLSEMEPMSNSFIYGRDYFHLKRVH